MKRAAMRFINGVISVSLIVWLTPQANAQDVEKIAKDIGKSPHYERAKQFAERIEEELNRRVRQKVAEKKATIDALYGRMLSETVESGRTESNDHDALFGAESRIFIFVSRSVPLDTLKAYAAGIESLGKENLCFVFRYFPSNFLGSFLRKDPDCMADDCVVKAKIIISDRLFQRYAVTQVPAVVFDPDTTHTNNNWLLVYGAVPLKEALTLFYEESGQHEFKIAANRVAHN
ncbi:hypothetical protein DSCW_49190 [Desulfosarcina widdelii]|uniref:Type-F conjugative transfer system pilin assembly protein TrbC n=2 Tax=Desulfosarcina widdelii TaxID=947919 RepID=A0A5K7Z668_9BACT|nr:hypothetical protein DSCW_49190 [Desulfosarcina widdelii]